MAGEDLEGVDALADEQIEAADALQSGLGGTLHQLRLDRRVDRVEDPSLFPDCGGFDRCARLEVHPHRRAVDHAVDAVDCSHGRRRHGDLDILTTLAERTGQGVRVLGNDVEDADRRRSEIDQRGRRGGADTAGAQQRNRRRAPSRRSVGGTPT